MNDDDVQVSLKFKDFILLLHAVERFQSLEDAVNDLYDEVHGLRGIYLEVLDQLKEIKNKI